MIYIEIGRDRRSDLWEAYGVVSEKKQNLKCGKINDNSEIWDVFKDFFKKRVAV